MLVQTEFQIPPYVRLGTKYPYPLYQVIKELQRKKLSYKVVGTVNGVSTADPSTDWGKNPSLNFPNTYLRNQQ